MRKIFILLGSLLLLFLAVGCGGATETAVPADPQNENILENQPDVQPDSATESETDVQTVAAKPRLIEFYADW